MNLWVVFLTGLTVGGLTCLAVQGGLLASVIASREKEEINSKKSVGHVLFATSAFLIAKFLAYVALGFLLGAFGRVINLNDSVQAVMQMVAGLYMIVIALNLLNIHPIFRYALIQPPRFLVRLVKNQSRSKDLFAPSVLGAMTILIPCGTTLAMEALAISSANALSGALILGVFVLGTTPLFFGIGALTSLMGEVFKSRFLKLAAVMVIYLGFASVNGSLVALNSPLSWQSLIQNFPITIELSGSDTSNSQADIPITQSSQILISAQGYTPSYIRVKKDEPVTLTLKSVNAFNCASAFRIPSLGISRNLTPNDTQTITFTPKQPGKIQFNCSMGMYLGTIDVV